MGIQSKDKSFWIGKDGVIHKINKKNDHEETNKKGEELSAVGCLVLWITLPLTIGSTMCLTIAGFDGMTFGAQVLCIFFLSLGIIGIPSIPQPH